MFESTGTIDESTFRELRGDLLPVWYRRAVTAYEVIVLAATVISFLLRIYPLTMIALVMVVVVAIATWRGYRNVVRTNIKRMQETTGASYIRETVRFGDAAVEIENELTGAHASVPYEKFVRMREITDAYVLFTEALQIVPVSKSELEDCDAFLNFLGSKPTRIKKLPR